MKGKWAEGIKPKNFVWVVPEEVAACERPGGYGQNHRRVRRQEEIIWLRRNDFGPLVSLSEAPHNLHNYDEAGLGYVHHPWPAPSAMADYMTAVERDVSAAVADGKRVVVHKAAVGDELVSLMASFLLLSGRVAGGVQSTAIVERLFAHRMGPAGRATVDVALQVLRDRADAASGA